MDVKTSNSSEVFEAKISFSELLELAADNDVEGFKQCIETKPNVIDEIGLWYGRQLGARGMVLEYRTPLMVASMYGSLDVMKFILSISEVDVNCACGPDKCTALHSAASGGSVDAVDAVKLLLANVADPNLVDAKGNRPCDVITVSQMLPQLQVALEDMLSCHGSTDQKDLRDLGNGLKVAPLVIPTLSENKSISSGLEAPSSPMSAKKEYPVDPSLPDIKNSIYATDDFRMYSFKIRPCSRAYSHDWTECPFVHPGENARRRDPRKFHYSCVPCPEFRKGTCRRGDMCEYAHGVFECWLHPAQYRTRLCKDGTSCNRRVCFFAHTPEELRPLYASTGSAVPSPRSVASAAAVMDMAAALNLFPGSPSAASAMSPSPFTPPLSPSGNGISHSAGWQQQNIPTLHLPGSNIQANNIQSSRLRSSLNARDIPAEELSMLQDMEQRHILNDMSCFAHGNLSARPKSLAPSNLDELFSAEISSPRYSDPLAASVFSPSHKSAVFNHFQQQQQSMLSPINTKVFSPKPVDHSLLQPSFGPSSPGMMSSPRGIDPQSSFNARLSALALRDKHQQMRSLSARDLGANLPRDLIPETGGISGSPVSVGSWSKWDPSSNGRADWSINGDELTHLKRSYTVGNNGEEPDLSWVQSLVKDSPSSENKEVPSNAVSGSMLCADGSNSNSQEQSVDHSTLGAWLDQIAAQ
ncbi:zinc finger CCCH domain-containing protein 24-like [Chenopodium quinoa]|uniref:zinc finger CCCH domain-containing protein 24-like n=1 Tax=Chenopodium quinoa TaxID=63459 RepID=UPI000B797F04|nr:zinc finger CCCH domain-containing protein 24-like [Chenopodium quinoa]